MRVAAKAFTITPTVHILSMIRNKDRMDYRLAISELVDNSFGPAAGNADTVQIYIGPNMLRIEDDGAGIEDIKKMFTLGESESRFHDNEIGQYGYGAKSACIWMGDELYVTTKTIDGHKTQAHINWSRLLESEPDRWPEIKPKVTLCAPFTPTGTEIVIDGFCQKKRINVDSIVRDLAETYAPALESGKRISVVYERKNGETSIEHVAPFRPEGLTDVVRFEGIVAGKAYTAEIGILSNQVANSGIRLCYGHRMIEKRTRLAGRSLPVRIFGYVTLSPAWKKHLAANKSEVKDTEELETDIAGRAATLLALAEQHQRDFKIEELNAALSQCLSEKLRCDPEGDQLGCRRPTSDGKRTKTANPSPQVLPDAEGDKPARKTDEAARRGIRIKVDSLGADSPVAVVRGDDAGLVVVLNDDAPLMRKVIEDQAALSRTYTAAYIQQIGFAVASHSALQGELFCQTMFGRAVASEATTAEQRLNQIMVWWNGSVTEAFWKAAA